MFGCYQVERVCDGFVYRGKRGSFNERQTNRHVGKVYSQVGHAKLAINGLAEIEYLKYQKIKRVAVCGEQPQGQPRDVFKAWWDCCQEAAPEWSKLTNEQKQPWKDRFKIIELQVT